MSFDGGPRGRAWPAPDVDHRPGCLGIRARSYDRGQRANGDDVWELVCWECGARLILVNGLPEQVATPEASGALEPLTPRAREALARMPAVLAEFKRDRKRVTKAAICAALGGLDPKTLNDWIKKGQLQWPPDGT